VLPKGRQSCQSTTMLRNECTHTFLYVFEHCGEYMLGLLLIYIYIKILGGVSLAFLSTSAVCVCMYFGGCLNWHILSLPCYYCY
jgi:hypothetical protein